MYHWRVFHVRPLPLAVTVTPAQQAVLEGLLRQHSCPQMLALRARIVLAAAMGRRHVPLAHALGCTPKTVTKWRARWAAAEAQRAAVEGDAADLKRLIARVLADASRSGAPDTFTRSRSCRSSTWPARPRRRRPPRRCVDAA